MKRLILTAIFLNFSSIYSSENPKLKRSEEVIAGVATVTGAAMCCATGNLFHTDCQLRRGTQKCPDCPKWDIYYSSHAHVSTTLVKPCIICGEKIETMPGFRPE